MPPLLSEMLSLIKDVIRLKIPISRAGAIDGGALKSLAVSPGGNTGCG